MIPIVEYWTLRRKDYRFFPGGLLLTIARHRRIDYTMPGDLIPPLPFSGVFEPKKVTIWHSNESPF